MDYQDIAIAGLLGAVGVIAAFALFSVAQPYLHSMVPTPNA